MKKTGNTITLHHIFVGCHREMRPIMRNGKPTKAMKEVYVDEYKDMTGVGVEFDGHEVFIREDHFNSNEARPWGYPVYRADGSNLTCMCKFGRYGQADHEEPMTWYKTNDVISCGSTGYQGATGRGWGSRIRKINW